MLRFFLRGQKRGVEGKSDFQRGMVPLGISVVGLGGKFTEFQYFLVFDLIELIFQA